MPENRPDLSLPLMREVRQRCGFGCVLCGFPIYEYDHILGWSKVRRHVATEITLLCDQHHKAKTAGFLPNERVVEGNSRPWNRRADVTKPYDLYYSGNEFIVKIGPYQFSGTNRGPRTVAEAIRIDGEALIWMALEDGHFLLNLSVYDCANKLIMKISDNEMVLNTHSWDIEIAGTRLTIREGLAKILFDILFQPPSTVIIKRGRILRNGIELLVTPKWVGLLNSASVLCGVTVVNSHAGLILGDDPEHPSGAIRISGIRREGWDRNDAIRTIKARIAASDSSIRVMNELLNARSFETGDKEP